MCCLNWPLLHGGQWVSGQWMTLLLIYSNICTFWPEQKHDMWEMVGTKFNCILREVINPSYQTGLWILNQLPGKSNICCSKVMQWRTLNQHNLNMFYKIHTRYIQEVTCIPMCGYLKYWILPIDVCLNKCYIFASKKVSCSIIESCVLVLWFSSLFAARCFQCPMFNM